MPAIQGHTRNYILQCHKGNLLGSDWECLFWYGDKIVFWNPTSPVPFHFLLLVALISRSEQPCNLFFQSRIELCSIKLFALWNTPRPELYIIASFILIPKHPELFLRPLNHPSVHRQNQEIFVKCIYSEGAKWTSLCIPSTCAVNCNIFLSERYNCNIVLAHIIGPCLVLFKIPKLYKISRHIESFNACMNY